MLRYQIVRPEARTPTTSRLRGRGNRAGAITVAELSEAIGPATHNEAEYHGLIEGLKLARRHGVERIRVYMDSELVVEQMNERSAVKQPHLKELHKVAQGLKAEFKSIRFSWVPREMNVEADELARKALTAA